MLKIKNVYKWRQLIFSLAIKDLKRKYRRASGGFGWMLVTPLVQMVVFTFIFRFLFRLRIEYYPLFLLCGLLPWSFLRSTLDASAQSILGNASLVRKTYFPREVLPFSSIVAHFVNFLFALVILFLLSIFYKRPIFGALAWLPLLILFQVLFMAGLSLFLAGLNTVYRETQFILESVLLVWFYLTPIVYPLSMVKEALSEGAFRLYCLNPMTGIISGYQQVFVYSRTPAPNLLFNTALISVLAFVIGWIVFSRCEDVFVDMV